MALVTRCPKCGTMFRVVPDQLRVSAGWVRCGHCQEVFDAAQRMLPRGSELAALEEKQARKERDAREERSAHEAHGNAQGALTNSAQAALTNSAGLLQRREGEPQPAAAAPKGGAASAAQPPLPPLPPLPSPNEPPPAPPDEQPNEPPPPAPAEKPSQPAPRRAPGAPNTAFMAELDAARAAVVIGEPAAPPPAPADVKVGRSGDAPPSAAAPQGGAGSKPPHEPVDLFLSELGEDLDDDGEAPLFVQRARRRQPASPHMRALLWCALAALTLTLVLQVLISERNWLAARQPALAPALRGLCSVFNCRVEPYQHIDAIVIDNSGFSRAEDGSFLFHYTLRNHAGLPVATPALELTLTDAQERALVRRVISVQELGAPASIAARGEYSGARSITLSSAANPSAVTGYKLLAFYP